MILAITQAPNSTEVVDNCSDAAYLSYAKKQDA